MSPVLPSPPTCILSTSAFSQLCPCLVTFPCMCVCSLIFLISSHYSKFSLISISHLPWSLPCVFQPSWNSFFDSCSSYTHCTIVSALYHPSFVVIRNYVFGQLSWNRFLSIPRKFYISKLVCWWLPLFTLTSYTGACATSILQASCLTLLLHPSQAPAQGRDYSVGSKVRSDWQVSKSV